MKTKLQICSYLSLILLFMISHTVDGQEIRITFQNEAQRAGKIGASILLEDAQAWCHVVSNVEHPAGTPPEVKIAQLVNDINAQCGPAVTAAAYGAPATTIGITGADGNELKRLRLNDRTRQRTTSNQFQGNQKTIAYEFYGLGNCEGGTAFLSLDHLDFDVSVSTFGKTGLDVANELAMELASVDQHINLIPDENNQRGYLEFENLPVDWSITFDVGGDCGIDCDLLINPGSVLEVIPTLSEWGVIILILLTLTVGMVFLYIRQTALAMPGGMQVGSPGIKPKLFDKKLYAKVLPFALLAGLGVLGLLFVYFGEITSADPFGTFVSMSIVAYMIHFVLLNRKTKVANKE